MTRGCIGVLFTHNKRSEIYTLVEVVQRLALPGKRGSYPQIM